MFTIHTLKPSSSVRSDAGIFPVVNGVLIVLIVLLIVYVMYELLLITKQDERMSVKSNMILENTLLAESFSLSEPPPFSYYSGQLEKRDIFRIPEPVAPPMENIVQPEKMNVPVVNAPNPMDLIKNLTLVGILLDQNSTAIIEDQQSKETLFLQVGSQVNEAVVEQIQKSKVIFNFHGQRVELTQ